jgi:chromate transporter
LVPVGSGRDAQLEASRLSEPVSFRDALRVWVRIALLSFGGPAGQIAVMHRILVEEKRWIGEMRFLHALNYCMMLPGPEATQLLVYIAWLSHRTWGGIVAGVTFILPGIVALMALSWAYALYGKLGPIAALFFGLKAAVLAIVVEAVIRLGKRALKNKTMIAIAAASFVAIFVVEIEFPWIVLGAGLIGWLGQRAQLADFAPPAADAADDAPVPDHARPSTGRTFKVLAVGLPLWLAPTVGIFALWGGDNVFGDIAVFFSKMAVVTFGGAYAVLAYVAQEAVQHYGWLGPGEMLDGLGMAETTPGPLIMVLQFVGFLAAFRDPGALDPLLAGTLGGLLATWVTFAPSFFFIFLGAPYIEALRGNASLSAALAAITAAVVGVILNLAAWFALHLWFPDGVGGRADFWALALSAAAMIAIFHFRAGIVWTLAGCSAAGLTLYLIG